RQLDAIPTKVMSPGVTTRVEKRREFFGRGIDSGEIARLEKIAVMTRDGEIGSNCPAAMLTSDDVLDLKRRHLCVVLGKSAILAPPPRTSPNDLPEAPVPPDFRDLARTKRAFDCRIETR